MASDSVIRLVGISKRFGTVQALAGVDLDLRHSEVLVLAGENGAGKTTLMNVLAGLYQPDQGSIVVDGAPIHRLGSPRAAIAHGIGMVHQHFELVAPFTALENIVLGHEGGWRQSARQRRQVVGELMERWGLRVDLDAPVRDLSVGVQQKIELLKVLYRGARVLILDEPTTHLTPDEVGGLFATIRQLVTGGLTVVLITHRLREIRDIGDRVAVMRRGQCVGTLARAEASEPRLVQLLMGAARGEEQGVAVSEGSVARSPRRPRPSSGPLLALERVAAADVDGCTLALVGGEVLGVAGVAGNGQRALAEAIVGTRRITSGRLCVGGRDLTRASVGDRLRQGLAYIPEDRLVEGILPHLSLAETFALGSSHTLGSGSWLFDAAGVRSAARAAIEEYAVAAPSEQVPTAQLSGGNIQKVLVARALSLVKSARRPACVVAMNPTRGLDLRSAALVQQRLLDVADAGGAVLLVSEDLDELMQLSDRIVVMYRGTLSAPCLRGGFDFDRYRIGALMAGVAA